jgi:hypothetical protein
MIYETFKKEFLAVSSRSMLAGCGPGSPGLRGRLPGRARMHAGARARGQGADRAEGPGSARLRLRQFSGCWVLGSCGDLRLLLDDNYSRTITNITAEAQSTRRTNEWRRLLLRSSGFLKCDCCRRSGLGCARGHSMCAGAYGIAAMLSGRSGLPGNRYARVCTRTRSHATEAVLRTIAGFGLGFQGVSEGF